MRRQWILIGQSILKTIRTIGDKKCPSRGSRNKTRPVMAGTVINGLMQRDYGIVWIDRWIEIMPMNKCISLQSVIAVDNGRLQV